MSKIEKLCVVLPPTELLTRKQSRRLLTSRVMAQAGIVPPRYFLKISARSGMGGGAVSGLKRELNSTSY